MDGVTRRVNARILGTELILVLLTGVKFENEKYAGQWANEENQTRAWKSVLKN